MVENSEGLFLIFFRARVSIGVRDVTPGTEPYTFPGESTCENTFCVRPIVDRVGTGNYGRVTGLLFVVKGGSPETPERVTPRTNKDVGEKGGLIREG